MEWINGLTNQEKRRLYEEGINKMKEWHRWFAWHPVTIGTKGVRKIKAWFCWVEKRGRQAEWMDETGCYWRWKWEYRRIDATTET